MIKTLQEYGLHHAGFIVRDVDETIEAFRNVYNIKAGDVYEFKPGRVWSYGKKVDNYCLKISMVTMDKGSDIEIIQPVSGDGVHRNFIESGQNGLHHLCFAVKDYDFWRSSFENTENEIVFESETEDELNGYRRCFYAEDKKIGMIYEIKEIPYFRK